MTVFGALAGSTSGVTSRNRGSLTVWFTPDTIAGWKAQLRTTRGGQQRHYADLAIENALTLRAVFRLALRQSEGLIGSIMKMLEIDLPVPSRRFSMRLLDSRYFGFRAPAQDRRLL